jgi:hypothetical protein
MFGTTNYPFNFANRMGIPLIESNGVTVGTENIIITLPNRVFRGLNGKGVILFRLSQEITDTTLPILFSANDFTQPVTVVGGDAATGTQMGAVGVYLLYYSKDSNIMQLLTQTT